MMKRTATSLWKYGIALYLLGRMLYWFNGEDTAGWNIMWLINEKLLPIACFLSIVPLKSEKMLHTISMAIIVFMAVYGVLFQGTEWAKIITARQVTGALIFYCASVIFFAHLHKKGRL